MAASESFKKSHSQVPAEIQQKISGKFSGSNLLCKSLILVFVLVVISLFPLQAPDFMSQNLLTNFWELLHLLFVGLAVCYGLFCKKCVEIECENPSENDISPNAIFPGVLNYPSFFEDGFENFCISDDKNVLNGYKENFFLDEDKKIRSFTSRNECGNVCIVRDENYKPLGLPVRSLRSGIADIPELITTKTEESSRLKIPVKNDNEGNVERIRGLSPPSNLGKKFKEVVGPSVVPWRSRSGRRMEMKEEVRNTDSQLHCSRHHSVGELEFEHLKSRVFQYHVSPSRSSSESESSSSRSGRRMEMKEKVRNAASQSHCRPHSVGELEFEHLESTVFQHHVSPSRSSSESESSPSRSTVDSSSVSLEVSKLKTDNLKSEGDFEDLSVISNKSKVSSIGSFSETEMQQKSKYDFLNSRKTMQNQLGDANQRSSSMDLNVKSSDSFGNSRNSIMQNQLGDANQRSGSLDLNVKSSNIYGNLKKNTMQDQLGDANQRSSSLILNVKSSDSFGNSRNNTMQYQLADANQRSSSLDLKVKSSNTFGNSKKSTMQHHHLVGAKQKKDSSYSSAKSSNLNEFVPRATKSVRTIRSSKYVSDKLQKTENTSHQIENNDGGMFGQVEAPMFISPVKKRELKHSPVDKQKYTSDKVNPLPNSTVSDNSHQVLNEKESGLNEVDEEELAGSEVDRKADEFITKFREQIRLRR